MKSIKFIFLFALIILFSCNDNSKDIKRIKLIYSILKIEYAPDKLTELYDIQFNTDDQKLTLTGEVTNLSAYYKLKNSLSHKFIKYTNKIRVLPDSAVGYKWCAVVNNPLINNYSLPNKSSELVTQALLGMPLKVLDKKNNFFRVQTPDRYISWVHKKEIIRMDKLDFQNWNSFEKIIYTKNTGYVYTNEKFKEVVSEITLGGTLKLINTDKKYFEVEYPDLRKGYIKKEEASIFSSWKQNLEVNDLMKRRQNNIEKTAKSFVGAPYLKGGTSIKGLDCSGFTKMVYLMNGFIIPRNASQQVNAGKRVDSKLMFSDLQKGDLLFFGEKATENNKQEISHVGIWLGNEQQEFIHASSESVHISSINSAQVNYDEFHKNRYLGGRRYLNIDDKSIIDLKVYKIVKKKIRKFEPFYKNKSNTAL